MSKSVINVKETVFMWLAILAIVGGCTFTYGVSDIIFGDIESGAAVSAVVLPLDVS